MGSQRAARVSSMLPVSSSSVGTQALIIDEEVYVLPDGTEVTIVRMLDDRDTADPEDDLLTITRSFEMWEGATKTHQIQRPRPPESSWSGWEDDRLTQAGTIEVYVEGIMIQHGTVDVTWQRAGDLVTVAAIEQELTAVDPAGGIVRTMITVDDAGLQQKTVYRISISDGYEIRSRSKRSKSTASSRPRSYATMVATRSSSARVILASSSTTTQTVSCTPG